MSFILDALKKSESDRQRQSGPSLFEVKVAPPRRALPVWALAIAVLLGVNVIVVCWMLLRRPAAQQTQQPSQAQQAQPAAGNAPAAATRAPAAPPGTAQLSTAGRPGATSAGSAPPAVSAAAAPAASAPAATAAPDRAASSSPSGREPPSAGGDDQDSGPAASDDASDNAPAVEPAGAQASGAVGTAAGLPIYQQIVTSDGLPELHLDLHVFAERPQDRFVMINMHRLGEGASLPNGVQVDAIRPDGVVLTYRGTRFLLPRN